MRRILILMLITIFFWGCGQKVKEEPAIKIGRVEITAKEFEDAFNASSFFNRQDPSGRSEFLDTFISRKLILKEAEREGLDKDPQFLKDVQLFWEQSLLKLMLSRKIKELSVDIKVEEAEIRDYYSRNKDKEFSGKSLSSVRDKIKWVLFNQKQRKAIESWTNFLRKKAKIDIDYDTLGIENRRR